MVLSLRRFAALLCVALAADAGAATHHHGSGKPSAPVKAPPSITDYTVRAEPSTVLQLAPPVLPEVLSL